MNDPMLEQDDANESPADDYLDDVTCYTDDGSLVVCDRKNPKAWVSSDTTVDRQR